MSVKIAKTAVQPGKVKLQPKPVKQNKQGPQASFKNTPPVVYLPPKTAQPAVEVAKKTKKTPEQKQKVANLRREMGMVRVADEHGKIRNVWEVPHCTKHYASARLFPWDTMAGACLPTENMNFPSAKIRGMASGTFRLGTTGIGYIAYLPAWGSDSANIVCTSGTSVGSGATVFSAFTNLTTYSFPQMPYTAASYGANLQGRFVAGGIRIQYVGTLMNQNGVAFSYCDIDHSSVTNTGTLNVIGNLDSCKRTVITGQVQSGGQNWITCIDNGPAVRSELDFASASSVQSTPYMIIGVQGAAGDQFEFEVVQHCEIEGTVVPNMTESHADAEGFQVIDTVIKQSYATGPPQPDEEKGILSRIGSALAEMVPKVQQFIKGGLTSVPGIVSGLMSIMPMTGTNPLHANQGFSYPMLMGTQLSYETVKFRQQRIEDGLGRGSNLRTAPYENFLRLFAQYCVDNDLTVEQVLGALVERTPKRASIPRPLSGFTS